MKILNECSFVDAKGIAKVEEMYNCTYVFETCLKTSDGNWASFPVAIFYTETAHPQGSNYMGLYHNGTNYMVTNGLLAAETIIEAIQIDDEIIYSRHRHDYREHNGVMIDGGRDYTRTGGERFAEAKIVRLKVNKDKLEVLND